MGAVTNNRFRPAPSPNDPAVAPFVADNGHEPIPVKILETVHENETNGHIPAGIATSNGNTQSKSKNFSFKQVRRNLTKQLSLDDFDWDAAKQRNEQIEQIALNDQEVYTVPESKLEKAWLGFLRTLSDTFLVARLTISLMSYLGVGECQHDQSPHHQQQHGMIEATVKLKVMCRWHLGLQGCASVYVHNVSDAWICPSKSLLNPEPGGNASNTS